MAIAAMGPEIGKLVLIIVDMQNDFVHPEGDFAQSARETPEAGIDMPFLMGTAHQVKRLADAFRDARRPVVYVAFVMKPDYSDAQWPYWRLGLTPGGNRTHCVEGTWGAQIIDDLKPREGEHLVVKKGFGGFSNTPLDTILRNMGVTTCVVSGVTTCVCVSNTVRGGVKHNYRMILVNDGRRCPSRHSRGRAQDHGPSLRRCEDNRRGGGVARRRDRAVASSTALRAPRLHESTPQTRSAKTLTANSGRVTMAAASARFRAGGLT